MLHYNSTQRDVNKYEKLLEQFFSIGWDVMGETLTFPTQNLGKVSIKYIFCL